MENKIYCYAKPNTMNGHLFNDDVAICKASSKEEAIKCFKKYYSLLDDRFINEIEIKEKEITILTDY